MADLSGTELILPRLNNHRAKVPAESPEEYFKRSTFIPFIDHVTSDLKERFTDQNHAVYCLSTLILGFIHKYSFGDLQPATGTYHTFIDDNRLGAELELWKQRWTVVSED